MRILVDASPLLLRSAGVKNYLFHWIAHLRRLADGDAVRAFPWVGGYDELTHEASVLGRWATIPRLALVYFVNLPGNPAIDWMTASADVFHVSNQVRRPPRRTKLTATVHDMTCWLMPELHTPANVRADKVFGDRVLRRAAGLIAVSENTRRDVVRLLDLDPERVRVIYPGVAEPYFSVNADQASATAVRYELDRPYVLFIGTIEPRKNIPTLLDGWAQLPPFLREQYRLVITGPVGWSAGPTLARIRDAAPGVVYLGYVPEPDLPGLTRGAAVFAYPSLYEGFGFPVAQAMACGVAVITSNVSSLPEVAGDGALLVDPRSPAEIRAALERLLFSHALRAQLGARGAERARQHYRWDACARKSLEFFRTAC